MSVDRCFRCGDLVDTDAAPESYVEVGNMRAQTETRCFCRECRESYEETLENRRMEPAGLDAFIADCISSDPRYSCDKCDWDVDGCSPCEEHSE